MHTQFEVDMLARAVHALEAIADELRAIRELKTQEVKAFEKKANAIHEKCETKQHELAEKKVLGQIPYNRSV